MRSGIASFNLGRYSEAKNCFLKGQQYQDEMGIKQWITWCDEKMAKLGIKADEGGQQESVSKVDQLTIEDSKKTQEVIKNEKVMATSNGNSPVKVETPPLQMPIPKIKHDWYQTETQVKFILRPKRFSSYGGGGGGSGPRIP